MIMIVNCSVGNPDPQDPYVLGLPDPDPLVRGKDPEPRGMDPDPAPDPSLFP